MRAATYHGREDVRVTDVAEAVVGPDQVRVDVETCGICGTDLHEYAAGPIFIPGDEPHPITGEQLPLTMGHEFAGVVTEVGTDVTTLSAGDHVAVNPVIACGDCRQCNEGNYHLCVDGGFIGLSGHGGGFAEHVVVDAEQAVPMPDSVELEYGALVEPLAVGLHAVRRSGLGAGDSVAVFGSGPIGLSVIQCARAAGATEIYVSEPRAARRELAAECGAEVLLDPTDVDPVEAIHSGTDGGVDVAFEVAGIDATYNAAIESTHPAGQTTIVSIFEGEVATNPNSVVMSERRVTGTLAYHGGPRSGDDFGKVIEMLDDGTLDPEALVTARIDLDDIVDEGFEALRDPDRDQVKILVEP